MIDVGVIGVGNMGQHHARILSRHKKVNSVYIYDKNYERAREVASDYDCLTSSTLESFFGCVNAVVIATPTPTHYQLAKEAMEHGLHTLVEKPLCGNTDDSKELVALADVYSDLVNGVGHIERFNPACAFIKSALKEPSYMKFVRHNPGSDRVTDTHVVDDLMIHDIDLVGYFADLNPKYLPIASCGDNSTFVSFIDNGFPIVLSASRRATKKTREVYIEDEEYTIVADLADQSVNVYHKPQTYTVMTQASFVGRINLQRIEPLQQELNVFLECIEHKREFPIPFANGHVNMVLAEIIKRCVCTKEDIDTTVVREVNV